MAVFHPSVKTVNPQKNVQIALGMSVVVGLQLIHEISCKNKIQRIKLKIFEWFNKIFTDSEKII